MVASVSKAAMSLARVSRCSGGTVGGQTEVTPNVDQCDDEGIDHFVVVERRRCDPQPLCTSGDGRIVDRLDIDAVLAKQAIAGRLAFLRFSNKNRDDVGVIEEDGKRGG